MSRSPKPSNRIRVKVDMSLELREAVNSIPVGGQAALDALRFVVAKAIWKLLPKDLRNKDGTINTSKMNLGISVDRRKP